MKNRTERVQFRMTRAERDAWEPLIEKTFAWSWSEVIRIAMRRLADHYGQVASDNGARRNDYPFELRTRPGATDRRPRKCVRPTAKKTGH